MHRDCNQARGPQFLKDAVWSERSVVPFVGLAGRIGNGIDYSAYPVGVVAYGLLSTLTHGRDLTQMNAALSGDPGDNI